MENNISDKELLAICNLSNLKMEFADLVNKSGKKDIDDNVENYTNHTIYSLLEQERNSIISGTGERAFKLEKEEKKEEANNEKEKKAENEKDKPKEKETDDEIYKDIIELKKEAGLVYEYFEKYSLGNPQGEFLTEWEIVCAYDGYKLIAEYLDMQKESGYKGVFSSYCIKSEVECPKTYSKNCPEDCPSKELRKIFIYRDAEDKILKDIYSADEESIELTEISTTPNEKDYFLENKEKIDELNLYPTRKQLENKKEQEAFFEKVNYAITLASIIVPAFGPKYREAKRDIVGAIKKDGQVFKTFKTEFKLDGKQIENILRLYETNPNHANKQFYELIEKHCDTALLKALYLSTFEATKKWTTTLRNWGRVYGELQVMYEDRFSE